MDGLGVTGVEGTLRSPSQIFLLLSHNWFEGVFRIACEVTLQLLHDNKDSLMSVLDAFVHDPLVEWEDEKRRMVKSLIFCSSQSF